MLRCEFKFGILDPKASKMKLKKIDAAARFRQINRQIKSLGGVSATWTP